MSESLKLSEANCAGVGGTGIPQSLEDAALYYAGLGLRVIPLHNPIPDKQEEEGYRCSCGPKCGKIGKHPRILDWPHKASADEYQIRQWWGLWPDANIGLLTGERFIVLDIDGPVGRASLIGKGMPPDGPWQMSGRGDGGAHRFFAIPDWNVPSKKVLDGVDCKGQGGYIVAEPSLHPSGNRYKWVVPFNQTSLPPLPAWVKQVLAHPTSKVSGMKGQIPDGSRHTALISYSGSLRARGYDPSEIKDELTEMRSRRCEKPEAVSDTELDDMVEWISNKPAGVSASSLGTGGKPKERLTDEGYIALKTEAAGCRSLSDVEEIFIEMDGYDTAPIQVESILKAISAGGGWGMRSVRNTYQEHIDKVRGCADEEDAAMQIYLEVIGRVEGSFTDGQRTYIHDGEALYDTASPEFERYIRHIALPLVGNIQSGQSINNIRDQVNTQIDFVFHPTPVKLGNRVMHKGQDYYLRLTKKDVVKITRNGWSVTSALDMLKEGIAFRPTYQGLDLPTPIRENGLFWWEWLTDAFKGRFANPEDQVLLNLWFATTIISVKPRMGLYTHGKQGSGKSTLAEVIKRAIDPFVCNSSDNVEKNGECDAHVKFANQHIVCIDNISKIDGRIQDTLSSILTGGGWQARKKYTDDEMHTIMATDVGMILNGINMGPGIKPDLLDRIIPIELVEAPGNIDNEYLYEKLAEIHPRLLGSLLQTVVKAQHMQVDCPPVFRRFVKMEHLWYSIYKAIGKDPEELNAILQRKLNERSQVSVDMDTTARIIQGIMLAEAGDLPSELSCKKEKSVIKDSAEKWVDYIDLYAFKHNIETTYLPKNDVALGRKFKVISPDMERLGIYIKQSRTNSSNLWEIGLMAPKP